MRVTAASIKASTRNRRKKHYTYHRESVGVTPRDGTKIRAVFDLFDQNRGAIMTLNASLTKDMALKPGISHSIDHLNIMYDMDIRRLGRASYCLAGRWVDGKYEDYFVEVWGESWADYVKTWDRLLFQMDRRTPARQNGLVDV